MVETGGMPVCRFPSRWYAPLVEMGGTPRSRAGVRLGVKQHAADNGTELEGARTTSARSAFLSSLTEDRMGLGKPTHGGKLPSDGVRQAPPIRHLTAAYLLDFS